MANESVSGKFDIWANFFPKDTRESVNEKFPYNPSRQI